eukprot:contig_24392_g6015
MGHPPPRPARQAGRLVATAAAAAVAAAAAAVAVATKPFPGLPDTAIGRFHLLPSLTCNTRAPELANGTRTFSIRPADPSNSSAATRLLPDATCVAPVENPTLLLVLPDPANSLAGIGHAQLFGTSWVLDDRRLAGPGSRLTSRVKLLRAGPSGDDSWSMVHPFTDDGLEYEADVARLLTLQRNSVGGEVMRVSGEWEVVALTRLTGGLCLNANCSDFSAVATLLPPPAAGAATPTTTT